MFPEHSLQKSCQNRLPSATFKANIYSSVFGLTRWTHCWQVQSSIEGCVGVSKSPLMQIETLAESIRGALGTVDLKSASVSENAWVWIITSKAFTVDACRKQKTAHKAWFYTISFLSVLFLSLVRTSTLFLHSHVCFLLPRIYSLVFFCPPLSFCAFCPLSPSPLSLHTLRC